MAIALYNCCTQINKDGEQLYKITKFTDGDVESSYITTRSTCNCPAGQRPTCRHRQMLPAFLNLGVVNTQWFIEWDNPLATIVVCDFQGNLRSVATPDLAAPACPPNPEPALSGEIITPNQQTTRDLAVQILAKDITPPAKSWRRL